MEEHILKAIECVFSDQEEGDDEANTRREAISITKQRLESMEQRINREETMEDTVLPE